MGFLACCNGCGKTIPVMLNEDDNIIMPEGWFARIKNNNWIMACSERCKFAVDEKNKILRIPTNGTFKKG